MLPQSLAARAVVCLQLQLRQESVRAQPNRPPPLWPQVSGIAAPPERVERHIRAQQPGARRIKMNIVASGAQIPGRSGDEHRFVAPAEKMSKILVLAIESRRIGAQQPLHAADQVGSRRFQDEVKMIWHETKRMN